MPFARPALIFLCAAAGLAAQVGIDPNGLATAAYRYATRGVQGGPHPVSLDLRLLRGDNGGNPNVLMTKATDVTRWTIFYDTQPAGAPGPDDHPGSASVKCVKGQFGDFFMGRPPVPHCKSLDNTWFAVNLDTAVARLNASGYGRGFSKVELKRTDFQGVSDEAAYVFTCPWERTCVAISAITGTFIWYQMF